MRNKKSHAKLLFAHVTARTGGNTELFVLARIGTQHFYGFIYRQGMRIEGVKKSVYGITFQKAAFFSYLEVAAARSFTQPLLNTHM